MYKYCWMWIKYPHICFQSAESADGGNRPYQIIEFKANIHFYIKLLAWKQLIVTSWFFQFRIWEFNHMRQNPFTPVCRRLFVVLLHAKYSFSCNGNLFVQWIVPFHIVSFSRKLSLCHLCYRKAAVEII